MSFPELAAINSGMDAVQAELPALGDQLKHDPFVIQDALQSELAIGPSVARNNFIHGTDLDFAHPDMPIARLLNKMERHLLIRHFSDKQHEHLITKEGRDSEIVGSLTHMPKETTLTNFMFSVGAAYEEARDRALHQVSWSADARRRYRELGKLPFATILHFEDRLLGELSTDLNRALAGGGIAGAVTELGYLLVNRGGMPAEEHAKAAHDLSHLALRRASISFEHSLTTEGLESLWGDIVKLEEQDLYVYRQKPAQKIGESDEAYEERWQKARVRHDGVFASGKRAKEVTELYQGLLPPTLKCPVHHGSPRKPVSNLNHQVHAVINYAIGVGLLSKLP